MNFLSVYRSVIIILNFSNGSGCEVPPKIRSSTRSRGLSPPLALLTSITGLTRRNWRVEKHGISQSKLLPTSSGQFARRSCTIYHRSTTGRRSKTFLIGGDRKQTAQERRTRHVKTAKQQPDRNCPLALTYAGASVCLPPLKNDQFRAARGGAGWWRWWVHPASVEADPAKSAAAGRSVPGRRNFAPAVPTRGVFYRRPADSPPNKLRSHATSSHLAITPPTRAGTDLTWPAARPTWSGACLPGRTRCTSPFIKHVVGASVKTDRATTRSPCGTRATRSGGRQVDVTT